MAQLTPIRQFKDHNGAVFAVAVFPDRQRMVTGSCNDKTLRLWDLNTGVVLKKMVGHHGEVWALAVSRDGQLITSGDANGELIAWHGETGEFLTRTIRAHSGRINGLDFSPDGTVLASGSCDSTTKLWTTKVWRPQGMLATTCSAPVTCVRYSPSGELLAIATTDNIEIYHPRTSNCIAKLKRGYCSLSLAWTPDGTRLLSGGNDQHPTIREWDVSTWKQVGDTWKGHTGGINAIVMNPTGMLVASASGDRHIRLWRFPDRQIISVFQHSHSVQCATFSMDGKHILSGGKDKNISKWAIPEDALSKDAPKEQASKILAINSNTTARNSIDGRHIIGGGFNKKISEWAAPEDALGEASKARDSVSKILATSTAARDAYVTGDLATAENIFTQEIDVNTDNYTSYANRSFVMARKLDWDHALQDAIKSICIKPSLTGFIAEGIALSGKGHIEDATKAFDHAFTSTNGDSKTTHFLSLIKAITLFNAGKHEEALLRVNELAVYFPDTDPLACHVVAAYLQVQLGTIALGDKLHKRAIDHFTVAADTSTDFPKSPIYSMYEEFTVLFGWDLKSLWETAHKQLCHALIRAGEIEEAFEPYRILMDASDEATKPSVRAWFSTVVQE